MASLIEVKSFKFAIKIVDTYKFLTEQKKEYVLSKQLLRSGTSIGANVSEGQKGQTTPDFVHKHAVALKEAEETRYWLKLLYAAKYFPEEMFRDMFSDCTELVKILTAICKTTNKKLGKSNIKDTEKQLQSAEENNELSSSV